MIRIDKPATPPAVLASRGLRAIEEFCRAFDANPDDYRDGRRTFEFDSGIYGHSSVKTALSAAQHGKCAFCESKVRHIAYGDVEHFRPKAASQQGSAQPLIRPGYYWLAYDWGNLLFCCQICNQRYKRNLFPLREPARRARSHHDAIAGEKPLLVNPAASDPARAITFRGEYAVPGRRHQHGAASIEALGLNRAELIDRRREWLNVIALLRSNRALLAAAGGTNPARDIRDQLARIDAELLRCTQPPAEFAALVRAALE